MGEVMMKCEKCGETFLRRRGDGVLCRACSKKNAQEKWRRKHRSHRAEAFINETCLGCRFYRCIKKSTWFCAYMIETGKKRPCPPGRGCTVREAKGPGIT